MKAKYTNLRQIRTAIKNGQTSCYALVEHYLANIDANSSLNAFVEVFREEALEKAKELDNRYRGNSENMGRLFGMVISIKDVLCYAGHQVTASSKILQGFRSLYSATAIDRIVAQDAIIIGRTNCDQFAMGSSNENSFYGPVRNAADPDKVPGGSSGGSAVSVQTDCCLASLGTDTGGSVRQPAAFCGVIGMKPTYGRISRFGLLAYGSSFDQIGTITRSVEDAALLLEIMAGRDEFDSTSSSRAVEDYRENLNPLSGARIAYFKSALEHKSIDPEIKKRSFEFMDILRRKGHKVEAVSFEYLDYMIPAYYVLTTAEASSNLARYDGIRYGYRSPKATDLMETYKLSRTEGFSTEVKRRIMLGTFVLSAGYYDAYYNKAQQVRRLIQQRTAEIFENYDFILMPVAPSTPWPVGEKAEDPVAMYLADIYTVQANMAGIPAISFPIAGHSNGLSIGIQIMADKFEESRLLGFCHALSGG